MLKEQLTKIIKDSIYDYNHEVLNSVFRELSICPASECIRFQEEDIERISDSLYLDDNLIFDMIKIIFANSKIIISIRGIHEVIINNNLLELLGYCKRLVLVNYGGIFCNFSKLKFTVVITNNLNSDIMSLSFCALKILGGSFIPNLDYKNVRIVDINESYRDTYDYEIIFSNAVYIGGISTNRKYPDIIFDWDILNLMFCCDIDNFEQGIWYDITTDLLELLIEKLDKFNNRCLHTKRAIN